MSEDFKQLILLFLNKVSSGCTFTGLFQCENKTDFILVYKFPVKMPVSGTLHLSIVSSFVFGSFRNSLYILLNLRS